MRTILWTGTKRDARRIADALAQQAQCAVAVRSHSGALIYVALFQPSLF